MEIYRNIWKNMETYDNISILTKNDQKKIIGNESQMNETMNNKL